MGLSPAIIARYNEAHVIANYVSPGDEIVAKNVADELQKRYPGYLWMVNVSIRKGLIDIFNMNISGQMGYTIKIVGQYSWDDIRDRVMRAGGELLERTQDLPRGRFNDDRYNNLDTDLRGLPIMDRAKG